MFSGPGIVAVLIGFAAFAFGAERALGRIREARRRYKALMQKKQQQVERIRKVATATLHMKRELRLAKDTLEDLAVECTRLSEEVKIANNPQNRTFVLDERRTANDDAWIVTVIAPAATADKPPPPWDGQRRFMVWAVDETNAKQKVERRFPVENGFGIASAVLKSTVTPQKPSRRQPV